MKARGRVLLPLILIFCLFGCGLSHTLVKMPRFSVTLATYNNDENILVVVPEFYGESRAFVSLIAGNLDYNSSYSWEELKIDPNSKQTIEVNEESRYIGSMFPFVPSRDSMESRVVFIKKRNNIYRVYIEGRTTQVKVTDFKKNKDNLPSSLATGKLEKWGGPREDHIGKEIDFYKSVEWKDTKELKVIQVDRGIEHDSIVVEFGAI